MTSLHTSPTRVGCLVSVSNPSTYTGRELDVETGLYNYRHRHYHGQLGRFVSRDPITYEGSQWNLYEYVRSRPAINRDAFGQQIEPFKWLTDWFAPNYPPKTGEYYNPPIGIDNMVGNLLGVNNKADLVAGIDEANRIDLPIKRGEYDEGKVQGVGLGKHLIVDLDDLEDGDLVGTGAAQTCTGVIIFDEENDRVYVFHFAPYSDDAETAITQYDFGDNAFGFLFGNLGYGANETSSNVNMDDAIDGLNIGGVDDIRYSESQGLWIDKQGTVHTFDGDRKW